ncbi:MAG: NTP transferase domain-containing protein [Coriobacteriia bacterium]|nr:NTP transferase domain-containing protein [Coriobacteriia bacterium]
MQVVIFNSGIGRRMGELTETTHKAMVPLEGHGETIFERQIRLLSEVGLKDFIITTGPFKGQIEGIFDQPAYKDLNVTFVENPVYATTNYIYSFFLAREHLKEDALVLHGDLVFNKRFLQRMLELENDSSYAAVDKSADQPDKDFKVRIKDGLVKEVRIDIFDEDCFAFQPFYRLRHEDLMAWMDEIVSFIDRDITGVYAENALNEISDRVQIKELSYSDDYVAEVDTLEDLANVSRAVRKYDLGANE